MTFVLGVPSGFAAHSRRFTPVHFSVPRDACDCHAHIFNPRSFPFSSSRSATPESASIGELLALERKLRLDRIVIVQPSAYGTDNACMLDALRQLGSRARGVAVVGEQTTKAHLDEMNHAGVRGIRISLEPSDKADLSVVRRRFQTAVQHAIDHNWHIEIGAGLAAIEAIQNELAGLQLPVVVEHFARADARFGPGQGGFEALLDLLRSGGVYVKISAAYRISTQRPDYLDVAPVVKAFLSANCQRVIWGTDWPHPRGAMPGHTAMDIIPPLDVDDGQMLNLLATWAPDPVWRKEILVENPARLYGF
jgi:predicted TIM-barrel fold metal-dependent hydrolase